MKLTITSEETKTLINAVLTIAADDLDENNVDFNDLSVKEETPYTRYEVKKNGEAEIEVNSDVVIFILNNRKFLKTCGKIYDFAKAGIKLFESTIKQFKAIGDDLIKKFDPETWKKMEDEKKKEEEYKEKEAERKFQRMYEEEERKIAEEEAMKEKTEE